MKKHTAQQLTSLSFMQMSVADLLASWPETIPFFLRHKMSCVGCSMSAFETLADAARIYNLSPDAFQQELLAIISQSKQTKNTY